MSNYTTELRFICEEACGLTESKGYNDVDNIIKQSRTKIFNFEYPIFDESYRAGLEEKIIRHFYTREICCETVGRWRLFLEAKMNEIMPYYNQRYKSEAIKFNPLWNTDLHTTHKNEIGNERKDVNLITKDYDEAESKDINEKLVKGVDTEYDDKRVIDESTKEENKGSDTSTHNSTDTTNHTGSNWDLYSDTPQGAINNIQNVESGLYLTDARRDYRDSADTTTVHSGDKLEYGHKVDTDHDKTDTFEKDIHEVTNQTKTTDFDRSDSQDTTINENLKRNFNEVEDFTEKIIGKRGSENYSKMLNDFRTTFLNIDMEIIRELETLFFQLW